MNRKAFFRSLVLGGIVLPRIPKLILTGGWMPRPGEYIANGFRMTLDPLPMRVLTHEALIRTRDLMMEGVGIADAIPLIVSPRLRPEVRAMLKIHKL